MNKTEKKRTLFTIYASVWAIILFVYGGFIVYQSKTQHRCTAKTNVQISKTNYSVSEYYAKGSKKPSYTYYLSFRYEFAENGKVYAYKAEISTSSEEISKCFAQFNANTQRLTINYNPDKPTEHYLVICNQYAWSGKSNEL